jgi:hypothetical protein
VALPLEPHPAFLLLLFLRPAQACLDLDLPIYVSHIAGISGVSRYTWLLVEMGSFELFASVSLTPPDLCLLGS